MEFGVGYFPTHDGIGPGDIARKAEERGQSALFFAERLTLTKLTWLAIAFAGMVRKR